MKEPAFAKRPWIIPTAFAIVALAVLVFWLAVNPDNSLGIRIPGTDRGPDAEGGQSNPVLLGKVVRGDGGPSDLPGEWPRFRGADHDAISKEQTKLASTWQSSEPRELWGVDVGEGYAGAAVANGRVYLMDYDREKRQDTLRCLSLMDGREIWRFAYPVAVKRNHGMSRTVPAVNGNFVVGLGPKCHVVCADATTGDLRWGLDLVRQFGATVPPWYAGQCPLIDGTNVILAPGGKDALLIAVELGTGKTVWQTPNPHGWKMTHSSIMPMEISGVRMYVYCANNGVAGVSAQDGSLLWETSDWKISIATVPSPLILNDGRILLSGGYNAGSLMLRVRKDGAQFVPEALFKLGPEVFGATQHTPILFQDHIYGVRPDGRFVCLGLDGKVVWTSDAGQQFGLGSFVLGDGKIYAMNDSGLLRLIEASPARYNLLAQAQVLKGRESWGPLALAGGRLIARDFTRMVCLDVAQH
jgi:outer membrane protein assembly factor BamB